MGLSGDRVRVQSYAKRDGTRVSEYTRRKGIAGIRTPKMGWYAVIRKDGELLLIDAACYSDEHAGHRECLGPGEEALEAKEKRGILEIVVPPVYVELRELEKYVEELRSQD